MKRIKEYVDKIDEELCGAKQYAEDYVYYKANANRYGGKMWSERFKEMANDELKHADYIHQIATEEINMLGSIYKAPAEMQEAWDKSHREYVDKTAWIRKMLEM